MPVPLSSLGPYEIVGPLGAGGMGQVFRAHDPRLQRSVALKILQDASALDPDRRRRFAQEAIAASALNHPNILTVFDVGADGETPYIVSELIEGVSLRAEMNRGRLPLKRILEIAHQIAEGLAAAHEAGITHRDLKPENVMITRDGRVKIVDFGLAKVHDVDGSTPGVPVESTQTAEGLIVGTVPYMSPEQARGEKADFRSDQFALGVILYEMAVGAHPFRRDTAVQTLSAIIGDEPAEPDPASSSFPTLLRWVIRRLLAKNPRDRYAHTADLAADLRTLREHGSQAIAPLERPRGSAWKVPMAAVALAGAGLLLGRATTPGHAAVEFDRYTPLATDAGFQKNASWSPDGTQVVYEAEVDGLVQIFTRTLTSAFRTRVTNTRNDCYEPIWSSDGFIYYHSQARDNDALWRISPVGGEPELVIEGASRSAISGDGRTIAFLRRETIGSFGMRLWMVSPPGGTPAPYVRGAFKDRGASDGLLRFSPDGSRLLVWMGPDREASAGFVEIPLGPGEPRPVLPGLGTAGQVFPSFSWLPDSRRVLFTRSDGPSPGAHLWLADTRSDEVWPVTVTPGNETAPAVSPDGRLVAVTDESSDFDLMEVPLDGSPLKPFLSSTRSEYDPAASPVTTQYAFVTDRNGKQEIWLQNEEAYLQQALVSESNFGGVPSVSFGSLAFSPDGQRLAFQRAGPQVGPREFWGSRLFIMPLSGGRPVSVGESSRSYFDAPSWSPDGESIAYLQAGANTTELALVVSRIGSGSPAHVIRTGIPAFVTRPRWSPDGRWIACETEDGLMLFAPDGSDSRVIGATGWLAFNWDDDSRHLYGLHHTEDLSHFMLLALDTQTGAERVVNPNLGPIPQHLQPIRGFTRLRGRGFLTSLARVRSDIYLIEGFRLATPWWRRLWPMGR